jgi:type IV pilus assembly protein PilN
MRLEVNLATRPYEDTRQFWVRWGTAVALIAILTLSLVYTTVMEWSFAGKDRQLMSQYKTQIASRDQEMSQAEAVLNRPENRSTRDRSQFLNQLIERKAFSWTQVFADLEKMMPARLHVVSIHPEMTEDNQLQIKLVVAGESSERALDLVRRMEQSPRFRQAAVTSENAQSNAQTPGDNVEFNITALYVPATPGGNK